MRDVLRSLLNEAGYMVISAAGGEEALNLAAHLDVAVAILDLAMPNGDGLYTCRALRRMEAWRNVPILILTNHHTDKALRAARRAGAAGFVCKPFIPSQLLRRIATLTGQGNVAAATPPMVWADRSVPVGSQGNAPTNFVVWERAATEQQDEQFSMNRAVPQAYRNIDPASCRAPRLDPPHERAEPCHFRLLVAEDEELTQKIVVHVLSQEEYRVDHVDNGQEALAAVIRGQYDLVLMDVNMPGLNGIEAARTIRSLPNRKAQVPIIAMTANAFQLYAEEMRAAGMNGYLMKPINPSALLSCVRGHLERTPEGASYQRNNQVQALDLELLREEARQFAPGAIGHFLDNLAVPINEVMPVVQGWVSADIADIKRRLHNLAGVAGTLGCTKLAEAARILETVPLDDKSIERFVDAACASVAAIEQYLGRNSGAPIRARQ